MNLAELIAGVYTATHRPDLVADTLQAIQSATLESHQRDFFDRDLFEVPLVFSSAGFLQEIEYSSVWPRFRSMKYLRYWDPTTNVGGKFFEGIPPEKVVDGYAVERVDVFYLAGAMIQIKAGVSFQYALSGVYLHPDITPSGYASWIAREHPFAIIYRAARKIFKSIGKDEEYARMEMDVKEQDHNVDVTGLTLVGT